MNNTLEGISYEVIESKEWISDLKESRNHGPRKVYRKK